MFRRTKLSIALLASIAWIGGGLQAQATPRTGAITPDELCPAAAFDSGACLTAVVSGGMSPLQAAVSQAMARGEAKQAKRFVELRRQSHKDVEQRNLESLLSGSASLEPALVAAPGVGTVSGYIHTLKDTSTYMYCGPTNCTQVGKVEIEIRMNIGDYPNNLMSGDIQVVQGPVVDITSLECLSRLDRNSLPDSTVFTWSNCPAAHNRDAYTSLALIQAQTWRQGGTRTEKYYNRYRMKFKTSAGSRPEFGPFQWETKRWYIPSSGHPYWQV